MSIESEVFKRVKPNEKKLKRYGFVLQDGALTYSKTIMNNAFQAIIKINDKGAVFGSLIDTDFNEEYYNIRLENNIGSYVAEVKENYISLLEDIKEKCFEKDLFIFPQTRRIVNYVNKQYGTKPEFLWEDSDAAVFREVKSNKWYGIIMAVDYSKFDKEKSGLIEVINVKSDEATIKELSEYPNYYPGYHMNKKSWLSIILDDKIPDEIIFSLIDMAYGSLAQTNSWIVPANPEYYDIFSHFDKSNIIDWKQSSDVKVGDTVYIYVGAPYSSIMYKTVATQVNIPYDYADKNLKMNYIMMLEKIKKYKVNEISYQRLNELGIKFIRGPRKIKKEVEEKF